MNVNVDMGNAPKWLVVLIVTAAIAIEMNSNNGREPPGLDVQGCLALCVGEVAEWTPHECKCHQPEHECSSP